MKNIIQKFKNLPVKTQSLLGIGAVVGLVVALPLFIYGLVNFTYDIRERASSGEPGCVNEATGFVVNLVNVSNSSGDTVLDYEIAMHNHDNDLCSPSNYEMSVQLPDGWQGDFYTDSFSLNPGNGYGDNHLYITIPQGFSDWPQTITISYLDTSGNGHAGSMNIDYSPFATATPQPTPPPTACASVPMTIDITPSSHNGALGVTKRYDVNVTNNDSAGCGTATVSLQASAPIYIPDGTTRTGWTSNFTTQNFLLPTNTTYQTHIDVTSPTANYSLGQHQITISVASIGIPQNSNSKTLIYNLVPGSAATAQPVSPSGDPNYCGGTCGSNNNCQANYFCNKGSCRNPLCPDKSNCNCSGAAATQAARATVRPTATSQVVYVSPRASGSPRATTSPTPTSTSSSVAAIPDDTSSMSTSEKLRKYGLWGLLILGIILILSSIGSIFKKKDDDFEPKHITLEGDQNTSQDKPVDQESSDKPSI